MLVSITDFASVWRFRCAKDAGDSRCARAVYYNTTGVEVNGKVRQRHQIIGYAGFHAIGGFDPNYLSRMIHCVFECAAPSVWLEQNKILFERRLSAPEIQGAVLVVTRTKTTGALKVGSTAWRLTGTWLDRRDFNGLRGPFDRNPFQGYLRRSIRQQSGAERGEQDEPSTESDSANREGLCGPVRQSSGLHTPVHEAPPGNWPTLLFPSEA
jgi:hypothetical protein